MTDAETGEEIYISPAAAAIWGNSVENILEEPDAFIQSVLSEDHPHVLAAMEQQRKGKGPKLNIVSIAGWLHSLGLGPRFPHIR